ncbi:MAG: hypothetical protein ACRC11_18125 [Xenococcaceae cyanobacterium]
MTDEELKQLVESNARTIQAMLEQQATDRLRHEERMSRLEQRSDELQDAMLQMTRIENGLARMLGSLDEDRPIILRRLMSIENKIDRLIEGQE